MTNLERIKRLKNTSGALSGGREHPDRCVCQLFDDTPHTHYQEPPYACARCRECNAYKPAWPDMDSEIQDLCQEAMANDSASVLLVRGFATGILQLKKAVKLKYGKEWSEELNTKTIETLERLCLPGFWSVQQMQAMKKAGASLEDISGMLRTVDPEYCEHKRATTSVCVACATMPGVNKLDE